MGGDRVALLSLSALELRDRLATGATRAVELAEACLARIASEEPRVQAWAWLDGDIVMAQARALDARRQSGAATGPLHGLPVGIKDIIDVKGLPTECGTPVLAGRKATADAFVVSRLRAAGAIIMGKTVTTEAAFMHPGKTRNPHNEAHTPGGSSSGSAAAVACGMVPLAIGTQTGGSIIRPASFCGVVGFKPSAGQVSRSGIVLQSQTLDTVGVFARNVNDAALLCDAIAGHDPADTTTMPVAPPRLLTTAASEPPLPPVFAFVRPPGYADASDDVRLGTEEVVRLLAERCFEAALPGLFDEAADIRERINLAEMAGLYRGLERNGRPLLSTVLTEALDAGKAILAHDYLAALAWRRLALEALEPIFERCDAILCPAAPTAAPRGLASTGSPIFNGLWSLCGLPAVTVPVLQDASGMPVGIQLVGRSGDDARLLRAARWLAAHIDARQAGEA